MPDIPMPKTVFGFAQDQGNKPKQEDTFGNFESVCFSLADGDNLYPWGEVASHLAVEESLWAYKHVSKLAFYWEDKKRLISRIFRTTSLGIWQKQKEPEFQQGLHTSLAVCIIGPQHAWVGIVGDTYVCHIQNTTLHWMQCDNQSNVLGLQRWVKPAYWSFPFETHDVICLMTSAAVRSLSDDTILSIGKIVASRQITPAKGAELLLEESKKNNSIDNQTCAVIQRISVFENT